MPDVAGDADPESGYLIVVDGQSGVIGGTSAVAPLWAALLALFNEELGRNVGWIHPYLYGDAVQQGALHDITVGNNGHYKGRKRLGRVHRPRHAEWPGVAGCFKDRAE